VNLTTTAAFSDLVVRATRLNTGNILNWVNAELIFLAKMQCELLIRYGILLRGGISIDGLFINPDLVFGPALVRAHELAENLAIFPRIVIDNGVINLKRDGLLFNAYRKQGDDGAHFIDYLYGTYKNLLGDDWSGGRFGLLHQHMVFVENRLREFSSKQERLKQKAVWLALYHNDVLSRLMIDPDSPHPSSPGEEPTPGLRARFDGLLIHPDQFDI